MSDPDALEGIDHQQREVRNARTLAVTNEACHAHAVDL